MADKILCYQLQDDETTLDALKEAIESHDSPELVRVQRCNITEISGMWVRNNLVRHDELMKARGDGRYYRDDRSTFQWIWSPDEQKTVKRLAGILQAALNQSGGDGDLCLYRWHEEARNALLDIAYGEKIKSP